MFVTFDIDLSRPVASSKTVVRSEAQFCQLLLPTLKSMSLTEASTTIMGWMEASSTLMETVPFMWPTVHSLATSPSLLPYHTLPIRGVSTSLTETWLTTMLCQWDCSRPLTPLWTVRLNTDSFTRTKSWARIGFCLSWMTELTEFICDLLLTHTSVTWTTTGMC